MSLESRPTRTFLDRMLENAREEQARDHSRYQLLEALHGRLTVYTHPIEDTLGYGTTGDEVYGCLGDKVVFHRYRNKTKKDENEDFEFVQWLLAFEGPYANIRYHNGWDGMRELVIGFDVPRLAVGRYGSYSIENGNFQKTASSWTRPLLAERFSEERLDTQEVPKEDGVHLEGYNNGRLVEEIVLPWQVDLAKWLPVFFDENDSVINDPSLPWQDWFKDLGVKFHYFPENTPS